MSKKRVAKMRAVMARTGSVALSAPDRVKYSDDEARDWHGQWTADGSSEPAQAAIDKAAMSGYVTYGSAEEGAAAGDHAYNEMEAAKRGDIVNAVWLNAGDGTYDVNERPLIARRAVVTVPNATGDVKIQVRSGTYTVLKSGLSSFQRVGRVNG